MLADGVAENADKQITICILSASDIINDPRVKRECDTLSAEGYNVVGVGLPGAANLSNNWRLLTCGTTKVDYGNNHKNNERKHRNLFDFRKIPIRMYNLSKYIFFVIINKLRTLYRYTSLIMRPLALYFRPSLGESIYWSENLWNNIYNTAKAIKGDVWIANDWNTLPIAARLAEENGGVFVYDSHEFAIEEYSQNIKWRIAQKPIVNCIEKKFIYRCKYVSSVSSGISIRLKTIYNLTTPVYVIMNTPKFEDIPFHGTGQDIKVLYHGIVSPGRGLEETIDSVPFWRSDFSFYIRGPGNSDYINSLMSRVEQLKLGSRVFFLPSVRMIELVKSAADFDIGFFALPGHSLQNEFALPNKFFEYMMAGLALCVSKLPEMASLMEEYDLGSTFERLDPVCIANAINNFSRDSIDQYKQNGLKAAKILCWEEESKKLLAAISAVTLENV